MPSLLELVLEANGGDRFKTKSTVTARVTYGGSFWSVKGQPTFAGTELVEARTQTQWIRHQNEITGRRVTFDQPDDRITVADGRGGSPIVLKSPRRSLDSYTFRSQWKPAQMAFFRSYATWHYLLEPFVFMFAGVSTREISSHVEHGVEWRGLSVTFPETLETHNRTQFYYFDSDWHLRRMDVQPEVIDASPTTHYIYDEIDVDGITLPTRRNVYVRRADRSPDMSRTPVTVKLSDIKFT